MHRRSQGDYGRLDWPGRSPAFFAPARWLGRTAPRRGAIHPGHMWPTRQADRVPWRAFLPRFPRRSALASFELFATRGVQTQNPGRTPLTMTAIRTTVLFERELWLRVGSAPCGQHPAQTFQAEP